MTPEPRARVWSFRVLALCAVLAPPVGLFAPLGMAPLIIIAGIGSLMATWPLKPWRDVPRGLAIVLGLVALWGAVTAPWAVDTLHSLRTAGAFTGVVLCGLFARAAIRTLDQRQRGRLGLLLAGATLVAIAVLTVEVATCGQLITVPVHGMDTLCTSGKFIYKRGLTVIAVLSLAAVLIAVGSLPRARAGVLAAALLLPVAGLAVWLGAGTLLGAMAVAGACFLLVLLFGRRGVAVMAGLFVLAVAATPVATRLIPPPGTWTPLELSVPKSLHHRMTIWHFAGERWAEKPMFGWGMDASRAIPGGEGRYMAKYPRPDANMIFFDEPFMPLHPHNALLQWWLEFGVAGAVLLTAVGAVVFTTLARWRGSATERAIVAASVGLAVVVLSASFGAWQSWWLATLAFAAVLMVSPRPREEEGRPLKILFLTENFPPETNAAATRVYERALYWAKWGHEVTVVTCFPNFPLGKVFEGYSNDWYKVEAMDGLRVVRVKTFISANEGFAKRTLDFLSFMVTGVAAGLVQAKPDVVVATSPQFFAAVGGWVLGGLRGVPFVFELGDLWPRSILAVGAMRQSLAIRMLEKLELFLYRRSACVVALTHAFKDDLMRRDIAGDKIAVVINGVDLPRYEPRPRDEELAREWGLTGKFVVGYVGTHGMAHGLINVIDAAERMKHDDRLRFLLVGAGAERQMLIDEAARRGLANVVFQPLQPKAMMPRIWSLCDVALVHLKDDPTFAEVIPSKIFEAMGMGLPILLVSPEGEASRIVLDDGAGLWVPAGRPQELADAVMGLADDDAARAALAARSLASAPLHSRERQARQMITVLEAVVRGEGAQAARFAV